MTVGLVANNEIRDNGTYYYCRRGFAELEKEGGPKWEHFLPKGEAPAHDWYLYVDDGRDDLKWLPPHPCAYYAIDTHLGYGYRVWKARHFDRVFVAQKDAVEEFRRDGVRWVEWLPLACDPQRHPTAPELAARGGKPEVLERCWDTAFVGFLREEKAPGYNNRIEYLDTLFHELPNSWLAMNIFHEAMALRYVKARIGFNVSIKRDLNMRVFEVMSTATPLLTNRGVEGIGDLFMEGEHYADYASPHEAVEVAKWLLAHQDEADAMGKRAHELVRQKHTYKHRMAVIVDEMKAAA